MVAEAATYGTDKLWGILKPIPVELDSSSPEEDSDDGSDGGGAGSSQGHTAKKSKV